MKSQHISSLITCPSVFPKYTEKKVCGMSTDVGRTGARQCAFTTGRWKGRAGQQGAFGGKRQKEGEREFEDECFMGLYHAAKNIPPNSECMGY